MSNFTVIAATTDAVTTPVRVGLTSHQAIPATIFAPGLANSETVTIGATLDGGVTSIPLFQEGLLVVLTATSNFTRVGSLINLMITKSSTAAPVGVFIESSVKEISS